MGEGVLAPSVEDPFDLDQRPLGGMTKLEQKALVETSAPELRCRRNSLNPSSEFSHSSIDNKKSDSYIHSPYILN